MVSMRRLPGPKNPAEMTYYVQLNGSPVTGASAAKTLSSLDSQTMALTLGHFVQVQAERKLVLFFLKAVKLKHAMHLCGDRRLPFGTKIKDSCEMFLEELGNAFTHSSQIYIEPKIPKLCSEGFISWTLETPFVLTPSNWFKNTFIGI